MRQGRHSKSGRRARLGALACAWAAAAALTAALPVQGALALASHHFVANHSGALHASAVGEQDFNLSPFTIACKKVKSVKGPKVSFPAATLYLQLNLGSCTTAAVKIGKAKLPAGKAVFKNSLEIEFHASGYAEIGTASTSSKELLTPKAIEITPGDGAECNLSLAAQTVPAEALKKPYAEYEAALYQDVEEATSNLKSFPSGKQQKLLIDAAFSKLSYTVAEGDCAEHDAGEHSAGEVAGKLSAELPKADLGWE